VPVEGKTTDTHPRESFVDNTTIGKTDDNHYLEPIPSSVSAFIQEEEGLVARMEEIIQFFLDFLQVTGGDLAPGKMCMVLDRSSLDQGSSNTQSISIASRES
jgi:hypothetical protein